MNGSIIWRLLAILASLLVAKTVLIVVLTYPEYFPPDFRSDFLMGRQSYFFGWYQFAFYVHIVSGPLTLAAGLFLLSETVRQRFPAWHRWLGRVQVLLVLFLVAPSGFAMAFHASTGVFAAMGFATLAFATAISAALGWSMAIEGRFNEHRRWMQRCYALLVSAVAIRFLGGLADVYGIEGTYPYVAWLSWLVPLVALEITLRIAQRPHLPRS